ncbi:cytochrome c biogenesis protein CcdA [Streptomyces cadmiisoli]|uniref:Cytochrome c biogenesis protein DipZ n=1 Tax=Streptomyces cadmiisoli TaxID=2184053 RepID=A0A2Z4JE23_9ACTN|nr:cytochrome c biogenesis protein CcdA [Streptomyces cadmiisoli]AWW43316.1 cytochrome c biogenesis protein DipZ [Streptomyces cadmiisoli]
MLTLILIGLVGGFVTAISPCVLPVLPVVFLSGGVSSTPGEPGPARRSRPYAVMAGLVVSFSLITLFGTLVLGALPLPKDIIRWVGLAVLLLLGAAMMFPAVQDLLERPFARVGQRQVGARSGFLLGLALGAVYVPCAGPVLAAITVAGATQRIGAETVALAVAFAVGTAIPLLFFALAGRRIAERVRAFRKRQRRVRFVAGLTFVVLAFGLTFNLTDVLQRSVPDYTARVNKAIAGADLGDVLGTGGNGELGRCASLASTELADCGPAPEVSGIQQWLNTPDGAPVTKMSLAGKVVLVDFWAYSCINCHRAIEHVNAWHEKYASQGLVVLGVHSPEYAFEHEPRNVRAGAERLGIKYPIALDNEFTTWDNFGNNAWPTEYLIDAQGRVRHVAVGEGNYADRESLIRQLLADARPGAQLPPATDVPDDTPTVRLTPEIGLGAGRTYALANGSLSEGTHRFTYPSQLVPGQFALDGTWDVGRESLTSGRNAGIKLNFFARDVHLNVGGSGTVTATVDGKTTTHTVSGAPNIYRLVTGNEPREGVVTVTLSPGLSAYSFTFG